MFWELKLVFLDGRLMCVSFMCSTGLLSCESSQPLIVFSFGTVSASNLDFSFPVGFISALEQAGMAWEALTSSNWCSSRPD